MADKLLLGIAAQGATAAWWRGNQIVECSTFANDEGGQAAFREYLTRFTNLPVHFIVDAVEEDYRLDTLPHVTGRDRSDMVGRKLKQHYRNTPYMAASLLGRDSGKRRDDRYLFSALTNPELIANWLQPVIAHDLPVAGIYLLPMVSAALLTKFDAKATNVLLVSQHADGLRLTYFRDRQFRLSRLTRGDSGRPENRVRYFTEEISNTRLYLHALRTMTLDEQMTVLMLDRGDELANVVAGMERENPSLECHRLGRQELVERLGVSESLLDVSPYGIYLNLLGQTTPPSNLAPASVTVGYRRYQARRAIYAACGALAAAALFWTGANLYQTLILGWETDDATRQTASLTSKYQEITRQFPQAPASAENLKKTVEIAQKLRASVHTPQRMMSIVSRALEASPTLIIREFGWKFGATQIEAERAAARTAAAESPAASTPTPGAGPLQARTESALIEGELRPFRGDYRSAIVTINGFASRLAEEPEVAEARVVKHPLDVNPTLSLSGSTLDNPDQSPVGAAVFKVLLVLKPAP